MLTLRRWYCGYGWSNDSRGRYGVKRRNYCGNRTGVKQLHVVVYQTPVCLSLHYLALKLNITRAIEAKRPQPIVCLFI